MRKLAQALGVEAMSLYNHVANKDDILDGMVDLVFGEIELPPEATDWKSAMRQRATSARALARHPGRSACWSRGSRRGDAAPPRRGNRLSTGGGLLDRSMAARVLLIDSYIYGFVLQEMNLPFDDVEDLEGRSSNDDAPVHSRGLSAPRRDDDGAHPAAGYARATSSSTAWASSSTPSRPRRAVDLRPYF